MVQAAQQRSIKAVIFDMDGVLIDSEQLNVASAVEGFQQFGVVLSSEERKAVVARHETDYVPEFGASHGLDQITQRAIINAIDQTYDRLWMEHTTIIPHAASVLRELKRRGLRLALATSSNRKNVNNFLRKLGFNPFESATTFEDVHFRKPHPQVYQITQERLRLPLEEIAVVEDSSVGIASARAAGLWCIAIPNKHTSHQDFSTADVTTPLLSDLSRII